MQSPGEPVWLRDGATAIDVVSCTSRQLRRLRRECVTMVFQQFGLLPWRSVRENVGFGLELRGESAAQRKKIVDEKLELVGLSQWSERAVGELSGGMQQRRRTGAGVRNRRQHSIDRRPFPRSIP